MTPLRCNNCGIDLTGYQNERFCPNCGSPINQNLDPTPYNAPRNVCLTCGTQVDPLIMKFCPNCGTGFKQEIKEGTRPQNINEVPTSIPTAPALKQQPVQIKLVVGELLKSVPFANMIVATGKLGGSIQLRRDGVLFITKDRQVIQSHITDITEVTPEPENNVITLLMMNGEKRTFSFAGANRWIDKIHQLK